jgi:hypothetical protein
LSREQSTNQRGVTGAGHTAFFLALDRGIVQEIAALLAEM